MLTPDDQFLVVATDGLWDWMPNDLVVSMARGAGGDTDRAASLLVREAVKRWSQRGFCVDDTTVVVANIGPGAAFCAVPTRGAAPGEPPPAAAGPTGRREPRGFGAGPALLGGRGRAARGAAPSAGGGYTIATSPIRTRRR
jgi:hypothetical protein